MDNASKALVMAGAVLIAVMLISLGVYMFQAALWLYIVVTTIFSICQYARQYRSLLHAKRLELNNKPTIVKG